MFSRFPSGRDLTIPTRKENRDDTITSTDDRGYATERSFGKYSATLYRCRQATGQTLSPKPRSTQRTGSAAVLPVSDQRQEGFPIDDHDCFMWRQVSVRENPAPPMADA